LPIKAHPARGYFYIAAATFSWALAATLGRAAFTGRWSLAGNALHAIDPLILSQSRTTFSFLVLLPALVLFRGTRKLRLQRADLFQLFLLGILGVAASNYFYYLAIQKTNVATAIILQYTAPVWVLLYMVARRLQRATLSRIAAVALALLGIALVIGIFSSGLRLDRIGVSAALVASLSFSFYNVGGHRLLTHHDRWTVLLYTTASAALFWIFVNSPSKIVSAHYSGGQWLFLLVFSLLSVLLPFSFYFAGLQHLEPTQAVIGTRLEAVFSILVAAIALGEILRPVQAIGIVFVLAAILVVQLPDRKASDTATLIEPIE